MEKNLVTFPSLIHRSKIRRHIFRRSTPNTQSFSQTFYPQSQIHYSHIDEHPLKHISARDFNRIWPRRVAPGIIIFWNGVKRCTSSAIYPLRIIAPCKTNFDRAANFIDHRAMIKLGNDFSWTGREARRIETPHSFQFPNFHLAD